MGQNQSQSTPNVSSPPATKTKSKDKVKKGSKKRSSSAKSSTQSAHASRSASSLTTDASNGRVASNTLPSAGTVSPATTTATNNSDTISPTTSQLVGVPQRGSFSTGGERSVPGRQFSLTRQQNGPHQSTQNKHAQIEKYFNKYKDSGEDSILAEGMEKFCVDLGVDPTEFIVLVLAWKFEASQMCRFTREEFINGCQKMQAHNAKSLRERFPDLLADARDQKNFKDLYNFTFSFGLDHSSGQRSLPIDMAVPLWGLVFTQNRPEILDRWFEYLKESEVKGVSRDTWNMFLPFVETTLPDLSNYDESEAWPSLFDDFVEHQQERTTL